MVLKMVEWFNLSMDIVIHVMDFGIKLINADLEWMEVRFVKKNVMCYNCNKPRHISKFCRSKNMKKDNLVKKNDPAQNIDPVETNEEMDKI